MNREKLCETFEHLINTDDEFLSKKTKLYCEYVLSLNKIYVDRIGNGYYEACEMYLKEIDARNMRVKKI